LSLCSILISLQLSIILHPLFCSPVQRFEVRCWNQNVKKYVATFRRQKMGAKNEDVSTMGNLWMHVRAWGRVVSWWHSTPVTVQYRPVQEVLLDNRRPENVHYIHTYVMYVHVHIHTYYIHIHTCMYMYVMYVHT